MDCDRRDHGPRRPPPTPRTLFSFLDATPVDRDRAPTPRPGPPIGLPPLRPNLLSGLMRSDRAYLLSLVQPNGLLGVDDRTLMVRSVSCGGTWAIRLAGYGRTRFGPFRLARPNGPSYHSHGHGGGRTREEKGGGGGREEGDGRREEVGRTNERGGRRRWEKRGGRRRKRRWEEGGGGRREEGDGVGGGGVGENHVPRMRSTMAGRGALWTAIAVHCTHSGVE